MDRRRGGVLENEKREEEKCGCAVVRYNQRREGGKGKGMMVLTKII